MADTFYTNESSRFKTSDYIDKWILINSGKIIDLIKRGLCNTYGTSI